MRSLLPIFLLLCTILLGCSAPEQSAETPKTTPVQTTPPPKTPEKTVPPAQTTQVQPTPVSGSTEDLGITDIEKDLKEMEEILSELEKLENMSFEI